MAKVQAKKRELSDLGTPTDDSQPAPSSAPLLQGLAAKFRGKGKKKSDKDAKKEKGALIFN